MNRVGFVVLPLVVLISCLCPFALGAASDQDLDRMILDEMNAGSIPSLAACIIKNDEIVWKRAYGFADIEKNEEAATGTIYLLASVTKLVIVTAVMQLAERGLIDLDRDINLYLPFEIRNSLYPEQTITTRMLLTHSSSLTGPQTDDELPGFYDWYPPDAQPDLNETLFDYLVSGGLRYVPEVWTSAAPGQRELYSNLGVTLLGYIIEFASGEEFQAYCRHHIFEPLDMPDTRFRMSDLDMTRVATRYGERNTPLIHYSRRDFPAGQLKSSVEDFSHFLIACMNGGQYKGVRILKESSVEEMLQIHNPASGLCLIWNCTVGGWFGHSGGVIGASTYAEFHKEDKVGLLIFSNIYLNQDNPFYPPKGKIFGLVRKKANTFRESGSGRPGFLGINFSVIRYFLK